MTLAKTKAAIYCRLSEEDRGKKDDENSESIQNQKVMLTQYAVSHGWEIFDYYIDDDYTGADRNRPDFNRLLSDAKNKHFDIVLCKTQSRFTREMELVEKYIHGLFPIWGIRFIGLVDNADTDNRGNKKARQINGLVNEWYLEDLSENIKSVLTSRREDGFHIGSFALYGYLKDPEKKGHLIIDEEAAAVVREVFEKFASGLGKKAIARSLNDRGVPNPTEYKRRKKLRSYPPKGATGTLWKYFAISDMLTNEIYRGNMVQGKYASESYKTKRNRPVDKSKWIRVENTHEAIISEELWNDVQALIKVRARPFVTGEIGVFARKVRCAGCGYVMSSKKCHGIHYLTCSQKSVAKDSCEGAFTPINELEQIVVRELNALIGELVNINDLEKKVGSNDGLDARIEKITTDVVAYRNKADELSRALREAYIDKTRGVISEAEYLDYAAAFNSDRDRVLVEIKSLESTIVNLQSKHGDVSGRRAQLQAYLGVTKLTRVMVDKLIDHIVVGKRDKETKILPVEIYWQF